MMFESRWKMKRAIVAMLAVFAASCSGAQRPDADVDCEVAHRIVLSVEAAVDAVDIILPADVEGRDESLAYAREGVGLGVAAVDACEAARDGDDWLSWVGIGLKILRGLVAILRLAGVQPPGVLGDALDLLVGA